MPDGISGLRHTPRGMDAGFAREQQMVERRSYISPIQSNKRHFRGDYETGVQSNGGVGVGSF